MIRPATHDDIPVLVEFVQACHEAERWKDHGLGPDLDSVIMTLLDLLESPRADLSVVDLGEGVVGACAVTLVPFSWDRRIVIATEWIWHMHPGVPEGLTNRKWIVRMLDYMLAWAKAHGAHSFKAGTFHDDETLKRALTRRGIRPIETACIGSI